MSTEIITSRPIIPHTAYTCSQCKTQSEFPTPNPLPSSPLQIRCFRCSSITSHSFSTNGSSTSESSKPRRGRQIGTQERPLETGYYELLGVPIDATTEDVKKAYRRLAIKHHPDKNRDDPHAEERFKAIAVAYQTLSDPALRKKYNEFGSKQATPEGGFMDPEEVFGIIFGGERFVPIIGHISLARDMKTALQEADEQEDGSGSKTIKGPDGKEVLSPEERARREEKERRLSAEKAKEREERVSKLIANLERKLSIFTESATGVNDEDVTRSWKTICVLEAEDLKGESFGVDLLHAVGFVYATKARHFMATTQTFMGVGGWLHNVQGKYHVFSETVSTVRAALDVKRAFDELAAAEEAGLNPEQKKKLEEQAAEKGLQALFKGAKLEIESVLRETCERLLSTPPGAPPISRDKLILRARALELLGEAYMSIKKDGPDDPLENEYVKVDTRNSKERESFPGSRPFAGRRDSAPKSPRDAGMRWN